MPKEFVERWEGVKARGGEEQSEALPFELTLETTEPTLAVSGSHSRSPNNDADIDSGANADTGGNGDGGGSGDRPNNGHAFSKVVFRNLLART